MIFLLCAVLVLGAVPSAAAAHVAVIKSAAIGPYNETVEGFRKACNCSITELSVTEFTGSTLLRKIHEYHTELILAVGADALTEARQIADLPIVYAMVPLSQVPGMNVRNISGVSLHIPPESFLSAMLDLFPDAKRIGIIYDPKNLDAFVKEAEQAALGRGVSLVQRKVTRASDVPEAIDLISGRVDVFWMLPDVTVVNPESVKYLLGASYRHNVPVFSFTKKYVEIGAAAGLHVSPAEIGAQAADIGKRILSDRNVKSPLRVDARKASLIVNDRIIRKLGTVVNQDVLRRAAHVQ